MLKMTAVELELISDTEMYLFVKKRMGGGTSYIAKRYSKANNKYMKSCDETKTSVSCIWMEIIYMVGKWISSLQ